MFQIEKNVTIQTWGNVTAVYAQGESELTFQLLPNKPILRYMAMHRHTQSWCRPFFGTDVTDIPENTVLLLLEISEGRFCAVVPVVNNLCQTTLQSGLTARMTTTCEVPCEGLALVWAAGDNPTDLIHSCVETALKLLGSDTVLRESRPYPEILEYLGWCTWDSMQIRVNEEGIQEKCAEFKFKNIPVKWAILDDMWAEIRDFYGKTYGSFNEMVRLMHSSKLYSFEADPYRFPHGLKHTVDHIHSCGMQAGLWFPVKGYWAGLDPEGPTAKDLAPHTITGNTGSLMADWQYDHANAWFDYFLGNAKAAGVDFVKVDNQGMLLTNYGGMAPIGQIAKQFHDGLEDACESHFQSRMINCMGMAPENIWNRRRSPISRCSDDFLPENKAWFTKHVLQCAYNSLLQGVFYWCDWDMWWTDDGQAEKNALMRAVSGGPVYVSDQLQRTKGDVLKKLTDQNGRILRCDRPAIPTADCATVDPTTSGKAMKIQNMAGEHGILAVLNLDANENAVTATVHGGLIDGFEAEEYALYEHYSGEFHILKWGEKLEVTLKNSDDFRLYILAPLRDGCGFIGRTDQFISPVGNTNEGLCAYVENYKLTLK